MRYLLATTALALSLAGCSAGTGTVTVNPLLLADGQLIAATLAGLVPLAPPASQGAISTVLGIVSGDITALQGGTMTQAAFGKEVEQNVLGLEPAALAALKVNPATQAVITSLTTLAGELLTESAGITPVAASAVPAFDPRSVLNAFVATHPGAK